MGKEPDGRIREFASRIKEKLPIDRIILFGSRARGDNFRNSDYDIIVISEYFSDMRFSERIALVLDFWDGYPLELEPICYTPKEFKIKSGQKGTISSAMTEGIEIG
ncbi:MAG: nucleotidyltransferase domain-containing protein [Candidatus Lokiarchaeota archaeon]|nr:nucleotidyltransferase domain-containing protein [Candidatus Lokiarchaeota archaeon]